MRTAIHVLTVAGAIALGVVPAWAQETSSDVPPLTSDQAATVEEPSAGPPPDQSTAVPPDSPTAPAPESGQAIDEAVGQGEAAPPGQQPPGAEFQTGLSAYQKQDFAAAAQNFESVVRNDPQSADAYFYLGYSLYKLKRFDESRLAFAQAYELQTNYRPPLPRQ